MVGLSIPGLVAAVNKHFEADHRITKDNFQVFIAFVASLCFLAHGFILTQSDLLLTSEFFLTIGQTKSENLFTEHFHTVFFSGELFGM